MPNGRCYRHGGTTPRGIGLPQFKHGRYSKAVPRQLGAAYRAAQNDPQLTALRDELALLTSRIDEQLRRMDAEPGPPWAEALAGVGDLEDALRGGDDGQQAAALAALKAALDAGAAAARAYDRRWEDVRGLIQERARVVAVESRRLAELDQVLTKERVVEVALALLEAVRDCVPDLAQRAAVQRRFEELLGQTAPPRSHQVTVEGAVTPAAGGEDAEFTG